MGKLNSEFVKKKTNSTIEQQKCKGHGKCDRLLVSSVVEIFEVSKLPRDPDVQNLTCFASQLI